MQHVLAENNMKIYIIEQLAIKMIISNTVGLQLSNLDYSNPQLSELHKLKPTTTVNKYLYIYSSVLNI